MLRTQLDSLILIIGIAAFFIRIADTVLTFKSIPESHGKDKMPDFKIMEIMSLILFIFSFFLNHVLLETASFIVAIMIYLSNYLLCVVICVLIISKNLLHFLEIQNGDELLKKFISLMLKLAFEAAKYVLVCSLKLLLSSLASVFGRRMPNLSTFLSRTFFDQNGDRPQNRADEEPRQNFDPQGMRAPHVPHNRPQRQDVNAPVVNHGVARGGRNTGRMAVAARDNMSIASFFGNQGDARGRGEPFTAQRGRDIHERNNRGHWWGPR